MSTQTGRGLFSAVLTEEKNEKSVTILGGVQVWNPRPGTSLNTYSIFFWKVNNYLLYYIVFYSIYSSLVLESLRNS